MLDVGSSTVKRRPNTPGSFNSPVADEVNGLLPVFGEIFAGFRNAREIEKAAQGEA
jgi:hypothetical protein